MGYGLAVDLGTTFTAAAVLGDRPTDRAEMLGLGNRAFQVPSVLYLAPDGPPLIGEPAERRGAWDPGRVIREFKRRIGDPVPIIVGGAPYSAHALTAKLLRWVADQATTKLGGPPSWIVLTHPANWGQFKTDLLRQSAELADLPAARLISEPVAAANEYAAGTRMREGDHICVYDLGGGTFDACVMTRTANGFTVVGEPMGIEQLGGADFDEAVFRHVLHAAQVDPTTIDPADPGLARLRRDCVEAKEALSTDTDTAVVIALNTLRSVVQLTRRELEEMIQPALADTVAATSRAIRSAGLRPQDLSAIVLTGGSAQIPLVTELLTAELGVAVTHTVHPKHGIALGATRGGATAPESFARPWPPPSTVPPRNPAGWAQAQVPPSDDHPTVIMAPVTAPTQQVRASQPAYSAAPPPSYPPTGPVRPTPPTGMLPPSTPPPSTPPPGTPPPAKPGKGRRTGVMAAAAVAAVAAIVTTVVIVTSSGDKVTGGGAATTTSSPSVSTAAGGGATTGQSLGTAETSPATDASNTAVDSTDQVTTSEDSVSTEPPSVLPRSATAVPDSAVAVAKKVDGVPGMYIFDTATGEWTGPLPTLGVEHPHLSPDRRTIIYLHSTSPTDDDIRVAGADGSGDRPLFDARLEGCERYLPPAWNEVDDAIIALPCLTNAGLFRIRIMNVDGTEIRQLDTDGTWFDGLSMSPDGRTLVYMSRPIGIDDGTIHVIPTDGSARSTELTSGFHDSTPMWSPDGSQIIFVRKPHENSPSGDLYLMDANGDNLRKVAASSADDLDPCWSVDGKQIVFRSNRGADDPKQYKFFVLDVASGNVGLLDPSDDPNSVAESIPGWARR